nr:PREDICTED: aminopeptidase Q-like [Bemisia tabaci]
MSTYLVAFVVSDFAHDEIVRSKSGIEIRVWARPNHVERNLTKFASNYAPKVLDYLEKYFDMKYPLPKLDMVAIPPRYFPVGGMENWGLVTFS